MANRIHIRGAQLVTMDADAGRFPGGRHPDRGRRHPCRRPIARRRRRGADRRRRHDRAARHHRRPYLPVADRAARLRARPVARRLLFEVPAAAQPLHGRRQFQRRLDRRLRDAVLRHDHRRRLLPRHPQSRLRACLDRGAEGNRHPPSLHLFVHAADTRRVRAAGGSTGGRPARLRRVPRSQEPHHHRLRRRIDRRTGPGGRSSPSRAISRRQAASTSTRPAPSTSSPPRACSGPTCW